MSQVTATLVVRLGGSAEASAVLKAEIDAREDGYNQGRTSFAPGDSPVYLVHKSADVTVQAHRPSAGIVASVGSGTRTIEEVLRFAGTREAELGYPTAGPVTVTWLGRSLGPLTLVGETQVRALAAGVALARVSYPSLFSAHRLANLPDKLGGRDEYEVLVLIEGVQG